MDYKFNLTADVDTNSANNPIGLEVWIDNTLIQDISALTEPSLISLDIDDSDGEHELKFVLKNKTPAHTTIDDQGNILNDSVITIKNIAFDGIELGHMFSEKAVYNHDFNGNGPVTEDKFYGTMGCNGSVVLKFTTPMYLWLLENM